MIEEVRRRRIEEVEELRKMGIEPYPYRFEKTHTTMDVRRKYEETLNVGEAREDEKLSVAGRVISIRHHGKSSFFHIKDSTGRVQIYINRQAVGDEKFKVFKKYVNIGDVVGIKGFPFKSKTGELTVFVEDF
ncbi:MAG: lysine--tRNA ligase, partial [Thermotoga sp. 4484_232]